MCTIPHTALPFQCGNHGGARGSKLGNGEEAGRRDLGGKAGEELCVLQGELPGTAEDSCWRKPQISDLVSLFGGCKGTGMPKPAF